jgi:hypothetical protein
MSGAALALALMHLQTNNASIAAAIAPPASAFVLEKIRPDSLFFRACAVALIMWDR